MITRKKRKNRKSQVVNRKWQSLLCSEFRILFLFVSYYTNNNRKSQTNSQKISMIRRPLFVVRIAYCGYRISYSI